MTGMTVFTAVGFTALQSQVSAGQPPIFFIMVRFCSYSDACDAASGFFIGCGNRDKINSEIALTRVGVI